MRRHRAWVLGLLGLPGLVACGGGMASSVGAPDGMAVGRGEMAAMPEGAAASPAAEAAPPPPGGSVDPAVPAANPRDDGDEPDTAPPLLIYTAEMTLAVLDVGSALDAVERAAVERGGYLLSRTDRRVVVRIPAARFHESLDGVAKHGDVVSRSVQARDVTEQVRDLRIRLENAKAMRKRLEELLARATDVKSALTVERELERITEQIERMTGQLERLDELVAFSTLTVVATEQPKERIVEDGVRMPFAWLRQLGLVRLLDLGDS